MQSSKEAARQMGQEGEYIHRLVSQMMNQYQNRHLNGHGQQPLQRRLRQNYSYDALPPHQASSTHERYPHYQ